MLHICISISMLMSFYYMKSPDLNLGVEKFGVEMSCNGLIELAMES